MLVYEALAYHNVQKGKNLHKLFMKMSPMWAMHACLKTWLNGFEYLSARGLLRETVYCNLNRLLIYLSVGKRKKQKGMQKQKDRKMDTTDPPSKQKKIFLLHFNTICLMKYDFLLVWGIFRKFPVQAKCSFSPYACCVHARGGRGSFLFF